MAKDIATKTTGTLYAEVTDRIIAQLEAGRVPWVQPWDESKLESGLPRNAGTGRRYSGINVLILWATVFERGFATQGWLTYKQAQALGGNVRKGETGTTICYADRFTPRDERDKPITEASDEHRRQVAFLKRFTVFNVDQCEGLPEALSVGGGAFLGERETIECAEALMTATGAQIGIGGDKAFYMPTADRIQLPPQQTFHDQVNYYRTALHELGHWTGHPTRLDRDQKGAPRRPPTPGRNWSPRCAARSPARSWVSFCPRHKRRWPPASAAYSAQACSSLAATSRPAGSATTPGRAQSR